MPHLSLTLIFSASLPSFFSLSLSPQSDLLSRALAYPLPCLSMHSCCLVFLVLSRFRPQEVVEAAGDNLPDHRRVRSLCSSIAQVGFPAVSLSISLPLSLSLSRCLSLSWVLPSLFLSSLLLTLRLDFLRVDTVLARAGCFKGHLSVSVSLSVSLSVSFSL
jgi:hypothetical protein